MRHLFVIVLLFLSARVGAAPSDLRRPVMVFLGDSITQGYGVTPAESYVGLIRAKMEKEGWAFEVENLSPVGETSAEAVSNTAGRLREPVDVLVIATGFYDGVRMLSYEKLEKNLGKIAARAYAANKSVRIVILGMRVPAEKGLYASRFNDVFRRVAWEYRTAYLPFLLQDVINQPALTLADRVHPNADGHRLIADNVWSVVEPQLRRYFPNQKKGA